MRKYEIMYILRPDLDQEALDKVKGKLEKALVSHSAKIVKVDEWGLRDLAYEIKKLNKGYYVVLEVEAENEALNEFKRVSNLNTNVLRFLITKAHEVPATPAKPVEGETEEAKDNQ